MSRPPIRVGHFTTADVSLHTLLGTELVQDVARGFEVYGLSAPGPDVDRVEALGAGHVPITALTRAWNPRRDLAAARELYAILRDLRLDVLHTHTSKAGVLGRFVGRLAGVPVVVNTCHGLYAAPEDGWARKAWVYLVEGLAAQFSDGELYQNDVDRRTLARVIPAAKARTVGNGIDLQRFQPDPAARSRVREELGIGDDDVLVAGVGRRIVAKGILEFGAVARALADRAHFVWVGPHDPDRADALPDDEPGVRFLGRRDDMAAVQAALDIFVLPSYREGIPRSAIEAAACRTAIVLTDIRGCRDVGRDGEHLLLVPPRDPQALTEAVRRLIDDPGLRNRLATAAAQRAHAAFDQVGVAAASIETYEAIGRRKGLVW